MSGWTDIPLSSRGYEQIERLRRRMRAGPPFDAIYSSPLQRAQATARPLANDRLGPLVLCPELMEIHCGSVEGWPVAEVEARFPALWAANLSQTDDDFRWPHGESYRELRERSLGVVAKLAERHRHGRVAIVTHAGVVSQIVGAIRGLRAAQWERFRPENTALTEIEWAGDSGVVVTFDDRAHLDGERPSSRAPRRGHSVE